MLQAPENMLHSQGQEQLLHHGEKVPPQDIPVWAEDNQARSRTQGINS